MRGRVREIRWTPERRCGQHQQVWNMNKVTKITLGTWAKLQKRGQKGRALAERHVSDQIANPGLFTANEPKLHGDIHVTGNSECSFCASLDFKWGWAQRWYLDIEVRRTSIKARLLVGHREGRKCAVFAKPSDTELALLHLAAALLPWAVLSGKSLHYASVFGAQKRLEGSCPRCSTNGPGRSVHRMRWQF